MKNNLEEAIPVLGSAASGLRFELALSGHATDKSFEESPEPFAILSHGKYSKVFLARVAMGNNGTVEYVAWKIQRHDYDSAAVKLKNPEINQCWEQEYRNLAEFTGSVHREVVGLFEFSDAALQPEAGRMFVSKPITFCKRVKRYFHPICPNCLGWLRDCTDDELLASSLLVIYQNSSARYLYCPACSQNAAEPTFYSYTKEVEGELPKPRARVLRGNQLYREWRQIFSAREPAAPSSEQAQLVASSFPCFTCEHRTTCYPAQLPAEGVIDAEKLLFPVSYYEFRALPLELLHIHYGDFCDLLGGQDWDDFFQARSDRGITSGQMQVLKQLELNLSSTRQFIFDGDRSGLFPLEVLWLKLIAFTQLCRGVHALHGKRCQPHLELTPANVMAMITPSGRDLPARWNFQIKLLDLGVTAPFFPNAEFTGIFTPPSDPDRLYTSPIIRDRPFGKSEVINVKLRSLQEEEGKRYRIELELISDSSELNKISARDLLQVTLNSPAPGLELWCRKTGAAAPGKFNVQGMLSNPDDETLAVLKKIQNTTNKSKVTCYTSFFTPCDVYSVGMLLFRTLLVNDDVKWSQVHDAVQRLYIEHIKLLEEQNLEAEAESLVRSLKQSMSKNDEIFSRNALIYHRDNRGDIRNNIPADLWYNILVFAFKLITTVSGFSICAHPGDYDPEAPGVIMQKVLEVLDKTNAAIHAEIFGAQQRNDEIWKICEEVRHELANL